MVQLWPVTGRGLLGTTSLPSSKRESESVFPVLHVVMTGCDSWSFEVISTSALGKSQHTEELKV